MTVKIAPDARRQFLNASGTPYSGAKLFYYAAGSTTKQNTYTTSAGNVANSNPIILDSSGRTPYGVWLTAGLTYKEVLAPSTDTDPPSSPIYTEDNISGVNDTSVTVTQWAASSLTPTYVSATSFTVPGDQTSALHVGRRLQFSVSAGTVYGRISATAYTTLTTVTMVMDSAQNLDSGLSSFNWSILTATNPAIPALSNTDWTNLDVGTLSGAQTVAGNKTHSGSITLSQNALIYSDVSVAANATTSNIWVSNRVTLTGTVVTFTNFPAAPQAGALIEVYCNANHVFQNNANLVVDGGTFLANAGDRVLVRARTTTVFELHPFRVNGGARAGELFDWPAASTPAHGLVCNGAAVSRTTYSSLFDAIGTTWGAGDGSTTFNVPNIPADYTTVMASSNEGTSTVGAVIAHVHSGGMDTSVNTITGGSSSFFVHQNTQPLPNTGSTGGSANLAAGIRVRKCIRI